MAGTAPQNAMQSLAAGGLTGTGIKNKPQVGDGNFQHQPHDLIVIIIKNKPQVGDGNFQISYSTPISFANKN